MEQQTCGHCHVAKPLDQFAPSYRGRPGTWCRDCNRQRYIKTRPPKRKDGEIRCGRCGLYKPPSAFHPSKDAWCKDCYREWHRARYEPEDHATDDPRPCAQCGKIYQPRQRRPSKFCSRACIEADRKESGRYRVRQLAKYGLTPEDYDRMLAEQGGGCAICGVRPEDLTRGKYRTYLHVDHDEATGRVRGLLCPDHNLKLGGWNHDPVLLRRAADYLDGVLIR